MTAYETGGGPPATGGSVTVGGAEAYANVQLNGTANFQHGCTVAWSAAGLYTVTLTTPRDETNSVVLVSAGSTAPGASVIGYQYSGANTVLVYTALASTGALTDSEFSFALFAV